jgi:hypothetical protein
MLMDLKQPLPQGSSVPLTLLFRNAKGVDSKLELKLPVAIRPPGGSGSGGGGSQPKARAMDRQSMDAHKY